MPLIAVVSTPKPLSFPSVALRNSTWHSERHQNTFRPLGFHLLPFTLPLSAYVLMWPCALKKKTKEDQKNRSKNSLHTSPPMFCKKTTQLHSEPWGGKGRAEGRGEEKRRSWRGEDIWVRLVMPYPPCWISKRQSDEWKGIAHFVPG